MSDSEIFIVRPRRWLHGMRIAFLAVCSVGGALASLRLAQWFVSDPTGAMARVVRASWVDALPLGLALAVTVLALGGLRLVVAEYRADALVVLDRGGLEARDWRGRLHRIAWPQVTQLLAPGVDRLVFVLAPSQALRAVHVAGGLSRTAPSGLLRAVELFQPRLVSNLGRAEP